MNNVWTSIVPHSWLQCHDHGRTVTPRLHHHKHGGDAVSYKEIKENGFLSQESAAKVTQKLSIAHTMVPVEEQGSELYLHLTLPTFLWGFFPSSSHLAFSITAHHLCCRSAWLEAQQNSAPALLPFSDRRKPKQSLSTLMPFGWRPYKPDLPAQGLRKCPTPTPTLPLGLHPNKNQLSTPLSNAEWSLQGGVMLFLPCKEVQ